MATIPKGKGHALWKAVKEKAERDDKAGYGSVAKTFKKDLGPTLDKFDKAVDQAKTADIKKYGDEAKEIVEAYKKAVQSHKDDMAKSYTPMNMTLIGLLDYIAEYRK
jgi:molecular chaperone GrpE (heat shock protein)